MPGKVPKSSPAAAGPAAAPASSPSPQGPPASVELPTLTRDQQLQYLREAGVPSYFLRVVDIPFLQAGGAKKFVDQFLADAVKGSDPVETLILQQLLIVHFRLLRLHAEAAETKTLESAKVYNAAGARLASELRRLVLALRLYRQPAAATKSFSVVHQQNVSTVERGQEIQYVDRSVNSEKDSLMKCRDRLNGMAEDNDGEPDTQPAARGGRADHRPLAAAVDA